MAADPRFDPLFAREVVLIAGSAHGGAVAGGALLIHRTKVARGSTIVPSELSPTPPDLLARLRKKACAGIRGPRYAAR